LCETFQRFRVTHPFHPLFEREFEALSFRQGSPEDRVFFWIADGIAASIPLRFTDLQPPDLVVIFGAGKCHFRVAELVELAGLMEQLRAWLQSIM
jgi:hypothetical protein